tara:strand:- start:1183 stop:2445 length:1263 start_codon:yes stop_codon:yes gene_type:complete
MEEIKKQYNKFLYPEPIENMKELIESNSYAEMCNANIFWDKYFPEKKYTDKLNVLSAGCGTNQIINLALENPNWTIHGIDLSEASIDFVHKQIKKYDLKNVTAEVKDIFDIDYKNEFDFVISTGVIHHTKQPKEALIKLVDATNTSGALHIMVYASYGRRGVYDIQKIMKYLDVQQDEEGINLVRNYIENGPEDLPEKKFYKKKTDKYDAGIIDTYLNPQDVAYDATDIEELIDGTGAYFQNWYDNLFLYPQEYLRYLNIDPKKFNKLNPFESADLTQRHLGQANKFDFILRKHKKFEFLWHDIKDIKNETIVKNGFYLGVASGTDWSSDFGGQLYYKAHGDLKSIPFNLQEGIIWSCIIESINNSDNQSGVKVSSLLSKCKSMAKEKKLELVFTDKIIKEILHKMWKISLIRFKVNIDG